MTNPKRIVAECARKAAVPDRQAVASLKPEVLMGGELEAAFAGLYAALVTPGEPHIGSLTDEEVGSMSSACYIRAIADRSSLEGTAYVEVMAGAYTNRCWNDGSLRADLRSLRIHPNQHA